MPLFLTFIVGDIHSYYTIILSFILYHSLRPVFLYYMYSSLLSSARGTSMGCRAEIRTRACLTASRRTTNWATPYPSELHRTLTELRSTPLSYAAHAAPYWVTPHPTNLRRTLLSYAAAYWATPPLMSYATPYWATPHPNRTKIQNSLNLEEIIPYLEDDSKVGKINYLYLQQRCKSRE
jgi:hypothetical protein